MNRRNVIFFKNDWFMQHNTSAPLRTDVNECTYAFTTKIVGRLSSLEDQVLLFYTFLNRRNVSFPKNNWFMHWSTSVILRTDVNECRDAFYTKIFGRLCLLEEQVLLYVLSLHESTKCQFFQERLIYATQYFSTTKNWCQWVQRCLYYKNSWAFEFTRRPGPSFLYLHKSTKCQFSQE